MYKLIKSNYDMTYYIDEWEVDREYRTDLPVVTCDNCKYGLKNLTKSFLSYGDFCDRDVCDTGRCLTLSRIPYKEINGVRYPKYAQEMDYGNFVFADKVFNMNFEVYEGIIIDEEEFKV